MTIKNKAGKICNSNASLSIEMVTPPTDPDPVWTVTIAVRDSVPFVPVTITVSFPPVEAHEMMALPEPVTRVGVRAQAVLLVARLTTPARPLSDGMRAVEFQAAPGSTVILAG